jgi:pimeloyl-ACP methyl ester carboxylesterase
MTSLQTAPTLSYDIVGEGHGVLFVAQVGYDRRMWDDVATALQSEFRCVLVDERGWGQSPHQEGTTDRVRDLRDVIRESGVHRPTVVGIGATADVILALGLASELAGLVLVNPAMREYMDPESPFYLGEEIEAARERAFAQTPRNDPGTGPDAMARSLCPPDWELSAQGRRAKAALDAMLTTMLTNARDPQQTIPVSIVPRLDRLAIPVTIAYTGQRQGANAASAAIAQTLEGVLPSVSTAAITSDWGSLLPLGEPERFAGFLRESMPDS